jgi:hypothetical protein
MTYVPGRPYTPQAYATCRRRYGRWYIFICTPTGDIAWLRRSFPSRGYAEEEIDRLGYEVIPTPKTHLPAGSDIVWKRC